MDPKFFRKYADIIEAAERNIPLQQVEEGWKDAIAGGALAASLALGGGAAHADAFGAAPAAKVQQASPAQYKVPSVEFLKKNFKSPSQVIDGAYQTNNDPAQIAGWKVGSDFDDLMMAANGANYREKQKNPNYVSAPAGTSWELVQKLLSTPEGKEYAVANQIGLSDINDTSPESQFQRNQQHELEKQSNAKVAAQGGNIIKPGWKYDQQSGMTPAQANLQSLK